MWRRDFFSGVGASILSSGLPLPLVAQSVPSSERLYVLRNRSIVSSSLSCDTLQDLINERDNYVEAAPRSAKSSDWKRITDELSKTEQELIRLKADASILSSIDQIKRLSLAIDGLLATAQLALLFVGPVGPASKALRLVVDSPFGPASWVLDSNLDRLVLQVFLRNKPDFTPADTSCRVPQDQTFEDAVVTVLQMRNGALKNFLAIDLTKSEEFRVFKFMDITTDLLALFIKVQAYQSFLNTKDCLTNVINREVDRAVAKLQAAQVEFKTLAERGDFETLRQDMERSTYGVVNLLYSLRGMPDGRGCSVFEIPFG